MQVCLGRGALMVLPVVCLLVSSCSEKPKDPVRQARDDARDIAMVNAAQDTRPPPTPLEPEPITAADIEVNKFYGAGCNLVPAAQPGGSPILVANDRQAVLKISGKFVTFAADPGSPVLAMGARSHYVGKAQSLDLRRATSGGTQLGDEASRWAGSMAVHDAWNQLVYSAGGELVCGS